MLLTGPTEEVDYCTKELMRLETEIRDLPTNKGDITPDPPKSLLIRKGRGEGLFAMYMYIIHIMGFNWWIWRKRTRVRCQSPAKALVQDE